MPKTVEKSQTVVINVDEVINRYNQKNPDKRQLDRKQLADVFGCNRQLFVNWKMGQPNSVVGRLIYLMELGQCELKDFVTVKDE